MHFLKWYFTKLTYTVYKDRQHKCVYTLSQSLLQFHLVMLFLNPITLAVIGEGNALN